MTVTLLKIVGISAAQQSCCLATSCLAPFFRFLSVIHHLVAGNENRRLQTTNGLQCFAVARHSVVDGRLIGRLSALSPSFSWKRLFQADQRATVRLQRPPTNLYNSVVDHGPLLA